MSKLSKEGIQLACDSVLIRNALALRQAIEAIEEKGFIPEGHTLIKELCHNLQVMEKEIERRGLKMPEEEQDRFLQGMAYTSEVQRRGSSRDVDSRISQVSARVSK